MADNTEANTAAVKADRRYQSRKFRLALLVILLAVCANAWRVPVDPVVADLVKWALGLYFTANVAAGAVPTLQALLQALFPAKAPT